MYRLLLLLLLIPTLVSAGYIVIGDAPVTYTLTVTDPGNNDTITCSDSDLSQAINCGNGGTDCTATAADGAEITGLTATADTGRQFDNWTGDVTSTENPTTTALTINANKGVGATFSAVASYADITFYADGSSLTTANKSAGSGTITCNASTTTEAGILGNSFRSNGANYLPIQFDVANNVDFTSGIFGFYWEPLADWANISYLWSDDLGSSGSYLYSLDASTFRTENNDSGTHNTTGSFTTNSLYYVTVKFDSGTMYTSVYNCSSTTSCSSTPDLSMSDTEGTATDGTTFVFGNHDGVHMRDGYIDQVMFSNDPDRDLLAIRNVTTISD